VQSTPPRPGRSLLLRPSRDLPESVHEREVLVPGVVGFPAAPVDAPKPDHPRREQPVEKTQDSLVAGKRGLRVTEQRTSEHETYGSLITATLTTSAGVASVGGTWMRGEPHIVRLDDWWLDVVPTPGTYWMLVRHHDRPGMIGTVGTLLGNADINISFMEVSREHPRGNAFMVLGLDDPVPEDQRALIRNIPDVASVRVVAL